MSENHCHRHRLHRLLHRRRQGHRKNARPPRRFYRIGGALMTVPVQTEPSFTPGTPEVLFEGDYILEVGGRTYDAAADGQRFLMIKEGDEGAQNIIVVQHWFEELRRLVPTN